MTRQGEIKASQPHLGNAMNGLNYFLLQVKDYMTKTSWWQERGPTSIGDPITATTVGVWI